MCVTCQLSKSDGGGGGKAVYIDTEGTFRAERIASIAKRFGMEPDEALENMIIARAYTHEHQMQLLQQVAAKMAEDQYRLIVVDSATSLFRTDFSGRGELSERQQKLAQYMSALLKLAEEFNVAVYITNQVQSDPSGATFMANTTKPIGGNIIAHMSTTRLSLRKGKGNQRICKVYDSPCLAEGEAIYEISDNGIIDSSE